MGLPARVGLERSYWGRRSGDAGRGGRNRRNSPRTRRHQGGTAPALAPPLHFPGSAFRSQFPVSPRYFGCRAPRPVTSPLVRSLPGSCDREMSWRPRPASSLRPQGPCPPHSDSGLQVSPCSGQADPCSTKVAQPATRDWAGPIGPPGIPNWESAQVLALELVPSGSSSLGRRGRCRGRATQPLWSSTCLAWKMGTIQIRRLSGQMWPTQLAVCLPPAADLIPAPG